MADWSYLGINSDFFSLTERTEDVSLSLDKSECKFGNKEVLALAKQLSTVASSFKTKTEGAQTRYLDAEIEPEQAERKAEVETTQKSKENSCEDTTDTAWRGGRSTFRAVRIRSAFILAYLAKVLESARGRGSHTLFFIRSKYSFTTTIRWSMNVVCSDRNL